MQTDVDHDRAENAYRRFIADIAPVLKAAGFSKHGKNWHWEAPDSWSVVNVQKSQWSSAKEKTVTLNLGVASKPLLRLDLFGTGTREPPPEHHCHWRTRLGRLSKDADVWWDIVDDESRLAASTEIQAALTSFACPLLTELSPETSLPGFCEASGVHSPPDAVLKHEIALAAEGGDFEKVVALLGKVADDEPGRQFRTALKRRHPELTVDAR